MVYYNKRSVTGLYIALFCEAAEDPADGNTADPQSGGQLFVGNMDLTVGGWVVQQQSGKAFVRRLKAHGVHMSAEQPDGAGKICNHGRGQMGHLRKQLVNSLVIETNNAAVCGSDGGGYPGHAVKEGCLSEDASWLIGGQQPFFPLIRQDSGADSTILEAVEIPGFLTLHIDDLPLSVGNGLSGGEKGFK